LLNQTHAQGKILVAPQNPRTSSKPTNNATSKWIQRLSWHGYHLALTAFSIYLLVVLATFDASDPTSTQAFDVSNIHNAGGTFGAVLADLFFWALGLIAYMIPILLIQYEITRFIGHSRYAEQDREQNIWFKTLTFGALIIAACVYASIHITNTNLTYPQSSGGLLGLTLGLFLNQALGMTGTNILVLTTLMLAISQFWQLSWRNITETLGRHSIHWYHHLRQSLFGESNQAQELTKKRDTQAAQSTYTNAKAKAPKRSSITRLMGSFINIWPFKRTHKANEKNTLEVVEQAQVQNSTITNTVINQVQDTSLTSHSVDFSADDVAAALDTPATKSKLSSVLKKNSPVTASITPVIDTTDVASQVKPRVAPITPIHAPTPQTANAVKEVKIVPLSETHKQDTGSSQAEQDGKITKHRNLPPLSLLDPPNVSLNPAITAEELTQLSQLLEAKLLDFGVIAEVVEVNPGPVITRIEIRPAPGTKVSKISNLSKDLARSMAVMSVRVVEVIAGKSVIGIEIPNKHREMVRISEVIGSKPYLSSNSPLTLTLGNDIAGKPVVVDLAKMPHLLVAGTTGSGKSVGVNAMIMSILLKSTPEQVRMLLVDPKMLELSIYDGIPHLLAPVITDMKEAAGGLRWCVAEMERRYRLMASQGVRNLAGFNSKVTAGDPILDPIWVPDEANGENMDDRPYLKPLPYIVVVVDEFADMIMVVGKKVEELIARIAQKARASGIHLILATQRPSVDVITGLIKANVPTRIAFQVSSKIDSRTILDQAGAESLLGNGDMLYLPPGKSMPERVHGAFVSDDEVHRVVEAWKQRGAPQFIEAIVEGNYDQDAGFGMTSSEGAFEEDQDRLYDEAVAFITENRRASISSVQRKFKIGYNRAARMIEAMEAAGVISAPAHNGSREVLAPPPPRD
jgi:S-DNA-T family DNA segregation ATPase FtsK/SpoIIIE